MPYDYIEEYQKQNDETIWEFRDKDAQEKISDITEKLDTISEGATKTGVSSVNGHLEIDDEDVTVYDDTAIKNALSTDLTEVEGNPIQFTTLSAQKSKSTIIDIEPIQDLHGYDKPWVGGAGKNLLPFFKETKIGGGCTVAPNNDGTYHFYGTATTNSIISYELSSLTFIGTYVFCVNIGVTSFGSIGLYVEEKSNPGVVLAKYNGEIIDTSIYNILRIAFFFVNGTTRDQNVKLMLIRENESTDFAPYSNICPISGRTEIGILGDNGKETTDPDYEKSNDLLIEFGDTVFGAHHDIEKGILTVDKVIVNLGDLNWTYDSSNLRFISSIISNMKLAGRGTYCLSSHFEAKTHNEPFDVNWDGVIYCGTSGQNGLAIVHDHLYTDATVFKTAIDGVDFVYELATPITIQLTPNEISLLKGVNNISTTADGIKLTYRNGMFATLSDLLDLEKKVTDEEPYGFIEHMSILDPAQRIEYIGKNKNYSPMTINLAGDHLANYNEWYDFPVIKENKPYMIKADGTVDYALDPNDYTKKFDGSASDVANTSYTGGAFAWIPKTYKREFVVSDDRYVYISTKKLSDEYEAIGFIDENGLEHDGAWIPMFYGTEITQDGTVKIMTLATGTPSQSRDTATQKTYIENFSSQAKFFGGPIVNVLADLLIMLGKNSDIQAVFGTGNMSGGNSAQYMKDNACINGGAFYGSTTNNVLNKAFHSLVLLTQNQYQRDPYTLLVNGTLKVSPYYKYDITGATYQDTGITYTTTSSAWEYPHKSISVPHWGAVPDKGPYSGSTTTGWADGFYKNVSSTRVGIRFANCSNGRAGGPRCLGLNNGAGSTSWAFGASALLLSEGKSK